MNEKKMCGVEDLLSLFEESLNPEDVLTAKLMAQVSSAITNERLHLQMSQQEFAKYIGVPQSLISRWEHGDYNFSIRKISEIMAKLNFDVDFSITPLKDNFEEGVLNELDGCVNL